MCEVSQRGARPARMHFLAPGSTALRSARRGVLSSCGHLVAQGLAGGALDGRVAQLGDEREVVRAQLLPLRQDMTPCIGSPGLRHCSQDTFSAKAAAPQQLAAHGEDLAR